MACCFQKIFIKVSINIFKEGLTSLIPYATLVVIKRSTSMTVRNFGSLRLEKEDASGKFYWIRPQDHVRSQDFDTEDQAIDKIRAQKGIVWKPTKKI